MEVRSPIPPACDSELLGRIGRGDLAPLGELYQRYAAMLLPKAERILQERADAEDTVHDVFARLPTSAREYSEDRGCVGAWLTSLVRNRSIDRLRRREGRRTLDRKVVAHEPRRGVATPEAESATIEDGVRVRRAVAALPDTQRITVERAFFEGLSYPEIATRERVPLGTVKSRANRGLATLRAALLDGGPGA
jgi:RNA polymerase sigma-70 factor (ECF subfamily)